MFLSGVICTYVKQALSKNENLFTNSLLEFHNSVLVMGGWSALAVTVRAYKTTIDYHTCVHQAAML